MSLTTAKMAINVVASLGVSKVVADIVKNNTTVITTTQRVLVNTGGFVLGSMLVDHACDHVNMHIDGVVDWYKNRGKEKNETSKSDRESETPSDTTS